MIRNTTLLLILAFVLCTKAFSQTPLTYHMGFDTAFQQQGWQAYRKGIFTSYNWSNSSFAPYAGDAFLYHDYPVGSAGTDTTLDWYVSPAFNFSAGGRIDSVHLNIYTISQLTPVDHFGIYLLTGSQDPAAATSTTLLADVTHMASSANTWSDTGHITIPPTAGSSYIGFKYRATNNWFTIGVDELYLTRNAATGMQSMPTVKVSDISLYPNPTKGLVHIKGLDKSMYDNETLIYVYDQLGREVDKQALSEDQQIAMQLPDGLYLYKIMREGTNKATGRLAIKN
ncbi:MAG: hypothetical protein JWO03_1685 [Bacteroidetes bacterium]|nr:hypothetical protein [Bacteroidota bacterium]